MLAGDAAVLSKVMESMDISVASTSARSLKECVGFKAVVVYALPKCHFWYRIRFFIAKALIHGVKL